MNMFLSKSVTLIYEGDLLVSTVFGNVFKALAIALVFAILESLLTSGCFFQLIP